MLTNYRFLIIVFATLTLLAMDSGWENQVAYGYQEATIEPTKIPTNSDDVDAKQTGLNVEVRPGSGPSGTEFVFWYRGYAMQRSRNDVEPSQSPPSGYITHIFIDPNGIKTIDQHWMTWQCPGGNVCTRTKVMTICGTHTYQVYDELTGNYSNIFPFQVTGCSTNPTPIPTTIPTTQPTPVPTTPAAFSCNNVTEIPRLECEALVAYNRIFGRTFKDNTPCDEYSIGCKNGHVNFLYEGGKGGSYGYYTIPPETFNLSYIEELNFEEGGFSGTISPQFGNLSQLDYLRFDYNNFTGSIPPELGKLTKLTHLDLGSNELTGNIPSELGNLTNLEFLDFGWNQLSGNVPSQLGNLTNLKSLILKNNQFSGALPSNLINLKLDYFRFENTSLCEPNDATFQNWLATIPNLSRTNIKCASPATPVPTATPLPYVEVNPATLGRGQTFSQPGYHFHPYSKVYLHFRYPDGYEASYQHGDPNTLETAGSDGSYQHQWQVKCNSLFGQYSYWAEDDQGSKAAAKSFTVAGNASCPPSVIVYLDGTSPEPSSYVSAPQGAKFQQPGFNFSSNVTLYFEYPDHHIDRVTESINNNGDYSHVWQTTCDTPVGTYSYWATDAGGHSSAKTTFEVTANSACKYGIFGMAIDKATSNPIAGVVITIKFHSTGEERYTTTDENGNYKFTDLPKGSYTMVPTKENYSFKPTSEEVDVPTEQAENFYGTKVGLFYLDVKSLGPTVLSWSSCTAPGLQPVINEPDNKITVGDHLRLCLTFQNTSDTTISNAQVTVTGATEQNGSPGIKIQEGNSWRNSAVINLTPSSIPANGFGVAEFSVYITDPDWSARKDVWRLNSWLQVNTTVDVQKIQFAIGQISFETPNEQAQYVGTTCVHHPDNPYINTYAQYAVGNKEENNISKDPDTIQQVAYNMVEQVKKEFHPRTGIDFFDPSISLTLLDDYTYLTTRRQTVIGDSRDYTVLITALMRSLGLPARHVWAYSQNWGRPLQGPHAWTEVYLGTQQGWQNADTYVLNQSFSRGTGAYQGIGFKAILADKRPLSSVARNPACDDWCQKSTTYDCEQCFKGGILIMFEFFNLRSLHCYEDIAMCYNNGSCEPSNRQLSPMSTERIGVDLETQISAIMGQPFVITTTLVNSATVPLNVITASILTQDYDISSTLWAVSPPYQNTSSLNVGETTTLTWTVMPLIKGRNIPLAVAVDSGNYFEHVSRHLTVNEAGALPQLMLAEACGLGAITVGQPITLTAQVFNENGQPFIDAATSVKATIYDGNKNIALNVQLFYSEQAKAYQGIAQLPSTAPTGNYQIDFVATHSGYTNDTNTTAFLLIPNLTLSLTTNKDTLVLKDTLTIKAKVSSSDETTRTITQAGMWAEITTPTGNKVTFPLTLEQGDTYQLSFSPASLATQLAGQVLTGTWTIQVTGDYQGANLTGLKTIKVIEPPAIYLPMIIKQPPPPTPQPTATPTPFSYFDDFSNSNSGWSVNTSNTVQSSYTNGEYEMRLLNKGWWLGTTAPKIINSSHYKIEVDAYSNMGGANYGLISDKKDWGNFYLFQLDPTTKKVSFWKKVNNTWTSLVSWSYVLNINSGTGVNRLKIERNNSSISLYVNNQFLVMINDTTFLNGQTGLYAESLVDTAPAAARFDNFRLEAISSVSSLDLRENSILLDVESEAHEGFAEPKN